MMLSDQSGCSRFSMRVTGQELIFAVAVIVAADDVVAN